MEMIPQSKGGVSTSSNRQDEITALEQEALRVYGSREGLTAAMRRNVERKDSVSFTIPATDAAAAYLKKLNAPQPEQIGLRNFNAYFDALVPSRLAGRVQTNLTDREIAGLLANVMANALERHRKSFNPRANEIILHDEKITFKHLAQWVRGEGSEIIDVDKSLVFCGPAGTGKSLFAAAIAVASNCLLQKNEWQIIDLREQYNAARENSKVDLVWASSKRHLVLDELHEDHFNLKVYGNDVNWASEILVARYNVWQKYGYQTILTSNLSMTEIAGAINEYRVVDRMREQYDSILFAGESLRSQK